MNSRPSSPVVTSQLFSGWSYEGFRFWAAAALSLAVLLGIIFGLHLRLSSWVLIPAVTLAAFTFYTVAEKKEQPYVLPGPDFEFCGKRWSAFQLCAGVGLAIGVAINIGLGAHLQLPVKISLLIAGIGLLMIPLVVIATKIISGEEQLCFYYDLITVLAVTSILLWLLGQPILPFLDVLVLAIGAARAFGFFGCLIAGCCYGRPARWGVVYHEHYTFWLPQALLGVNIFPIRVL